MLKVVEIRINGEGQQYSHVYLDANYKLINIVVYFKGSADGKCRVESFHQVNDKDYILYLTSILSKDSYVNAYGVLIRK